MNPTRPLAAGCVVVGRGAGLEPKTIAAGAAGTVLTTATLGVEPAFAAPAAVSLTSGVTGILPLANGGTGSALGPQRRRIAPTYGVSVAINAALADEFTINVSDGVGFTIANPTNGSDGMAITIMVRNASGGIMGLVTWDTAYRLAAWTNPANAFSRTATFSFNTVVWREISRTPADVPN